VAWLAPALAGPLSVLAALPIYLGQRQSLTIPTWLEPIGAGSIIVFALVLPAWTLVPALLISGAADRLRRASPGPRPAGPAPPTHVAMISLALFPLVLVGFSAAVQPSLLDRYAMVVVLCGAPVVAAGFQRLGMGARVGGAAVLLALAILSAQVAVARGSPYRIPDSATVKAVADLVPAGDFVVVCTRHDLYPMALGVRSGGRRLVFPVLPGGDVPFARPIQIIERDVARVHATVFDFPILVTVDSLRTLPAFWAVSRNDPPCDSPGWFPQHAARRAGGNLFQMTHR
jgi:hypothetical protein